jgi:putative solute:sodium symporter small subunit
VPIGGPPNSANTPRFHGLSIGIEPKSYTAARLHDVSFFTNPESGCKTGSWGLGGTSGLSNPFLPRIRIQCAAHCWEVTRPMAKSNDEVHWTRTRNLMFAHLFIWFFFGYVIHMFVKQLNEITIPVLQFPLGFYMAAQGSLIVFVVMLFVFAKQQDNIDRQHGVAEDD